MCGQRRQGALEHGSDSMKRGHEAMTTEAPLSVADALQRMQQAVRNGDFQEAADIGASTVIPLNLATSKDLTLGPELARGAEGSVLLGNWHGQQVAVKRFKISQSDDLVRFRRELATLAQLSHPHVMPVLGARALPPDYFLVMPLAVSSLHAMLYQQGWRPGMLEVLRIALQLSDALSYLHSHGLVHRDIKPSNVMQAPEARGVWLTDFGLAVTPEGAVEATTVTQTTVRSRGKPTGGFHKRGMMGTLEYMAPEVLLKAPASHASDVYALAITVNELATGVYPFSDCTKDNPEVHTVLEHGYGRQELAAAVASDGLRPLLPRAAPAAYKQLLEACWRLDPQQRPSAGEVRDAVAALLQDLEQQQQQQQVVQHEPSWSEWQQGLAEEAAVPPPAAYTPMSTCSSQCGGMSPPLTSSSSNSSSMTVSHPMSPSMPGSHAKSAALPYPPAPQQRGQPGQLLWSPHQQQQQQDQPQEQQQKLGLDWLCSSDHSSLCPMELDSPGWRTPLGPAAAAAAAAAPGASRSSQPLLPLSDALAATAAAFPARPGQEVQAGVYAAMGPRDTMEDRHVVIRGLGGDPGVHFAGVFDGHRGFQAAHYAALHLPRALQVAAVKAYHSSSSTSVDSKAGAAGAAAEALKEAFLTVDAAFYNEWQLDTRAKAQRSRAKEPFPGCTALAAVIAGSALLVANAGDGRAVLSRGGRAVPLCRQHTAELPDERARIEAAGGRVTQRGGSWRVGDAALQVTRALGDFDLKTSDGVTAEPEVVEVQLQEEDQFLILASDGLWDVVSDQEAVGLVMDTVKDPSLCAKRLVLEAMSRSSQDNVSIVIIFLQPVSTLERVWVRGAGVAAPAATDTFYGTRRKTLAQATGQLPPGAADRGACNDEMQDTY